MKQELDLSGLSPALLHVFAVECVEHVLEHDTPELCRQGLEVKRRWILSPEKGARTLVAFRKVVESSAVSERTLWRDAGIPAIALRATLAAMSEDAIRAAAEAATEACTLAAQRGYARCSAQGIRERGDSADEARELEARWQRARLDALGLACPDQGGGIQSSPKAATPFHLPSVKSSQSSGSSG